MNPFRKNKHFIYLGIAATGFLVISCTKKTETSGPDSVKNVAAAAAPVIDAKPAASPADAIYPIKSGIIHGEEDAMGMKMNSTNISMIMERRLPKRQKLTWIWAAQK